MGPFAFCHHPDVLSAAYVLAGHVHPVYRLRAGWESLLLPCFLASPQRMLLPSFGAFTGGHAVLPQPGERVFVSSGEAVWEIPDKLCGIFLHRLLARPTCAHGH
jgi:metallophosphoesterase superfamily enzyme